MIDIRDLHIAASHLRNAGIEEVIIKGNPSLDPLLEEIARTAYLNDLKIGPGPIDPSINVAAYKTNEVTFYFI